MNTAVATRKDALPDIAISEQELMSVLRGSLYPGAKDESIKMVIGYCKASRLDPMQKPVHIVPMAVSTGRKDEKGWDIKEMRDVVMPGIGLYRIKASRTGQYAGISEPEFGNIVTESLGGVSVAYPEWCRVSVRRILTNGTIAEFSAKEYWKENYATKSSSSDAPNSMWKKRPLAQLAKCAEAQALRKAFPDETGSQPTADEMEGKTLDGLVIDAESGQVVNDRRTPATQSSNSAPLSQTDTSKGAIPICTPERFAQRREGWERLVKAGKPVNALIAMIQSKETLTEEQKIEIASWAPNAGSNNANP